MSKIVVIGSLNMDHIVHVPHMVKQGETILAKDDLREEKVQTRPMP